jgi:lysine 2,3-aminomutase
VSSEAFTELDWQRLPGYRQVPETQWRDAHWQRRNSVRTVAELREVLGAGTLSAALAADILEDQRRMATMPMRIPPHVINTMRETELEIDPVRRYMAPAFSERDPVWPSHPFAHRDPLGEAGMWAVEGLVHRYPSKVLIELAATCPQYCGHCTRMDLVGPDTPQTIKQRFRDRPSIRRQASLDYLRATPTIRDVVVSGGDVADVPIKRLLEFVLALLEIPSIRDIRLASKALVAMPQHFLQAEVMEGFEQLGQAATARGVSLSLHTHANHAQQLTPLVAEATAPLRSWGFRDVRNQGVLLRGVNASAEALLDLCLAALDRAAITPYYFYMCDMIPGSEHWRTPLWQAQELQLALMGRLPGYATPRIVCDVPGAGKMWVHQVDEYDRERGISTWTPSFAPEPGPFHYYDPLDSVPESGREWWRSLSTPEMAWTAGR